jgi:hypothetical protein
LFSGKICLNLKKRIIGFNKPIKINTQMHELH